MRRRWLLAFGLAAGLAVVGGRGQAAEPELTIIEPYGAGSVTDRIIDSLKPEIGDAALLRETMARDGQVIKEVVDLLH